MEQFKKLSAERSIHLNLALPVSNPLFLVNFFNPSSLLFVQGSIGFNGNNTFFTASFQNSALKQTNKCHT